MECQPQHRLIVLAHQLFERSLISLLRRSNQFGIIYPARALAHHTYLLGEPVALPVPFGLPLPWGRVRRSLGWTEQSTVR